jgi:dual specificity tyrosine-phosphorylation-regulated kinase 2/3/4
MCDRISICTHDSSHQTLDITDADDETDGSLLHAHMRGWENMSFSADPEHVLENYRTCLSDLETQEILNYNHIYCIADKQNKLLTDKVEDYQDDDGMYTVIPGDHLKYRYEIIELIGKGSYAHVVKAYDHKTHTDVAIKIISSTHFDVAATEAQILDYVKNHGGCCQNIVELKKRFFFRNYACFVFELAQCNLFDYVRQNFPLPLNLIRKISIQLLQALNFLGSHGIIHCDIKAENILVTETENHELNVKIADFGLACFDSDELYAEVQSLWCRAPEVLLQTDYSTQIDMWSFACVLGFMYTGKYIFRGEGCQDQLYAIMEVVGLPSENLLESSQNKDNWFEENGHLKGQKCSGRRPRIPNSVSLEKVFKGADQKFVDFAKKCLNCDPDERFCPEDALGHEWVLEGMARPALKHIDSMSCDVSNEREGDNVSIPCRSSFVSSSRNLFQSCLPKNLVA